MALAGFTLPWLLYHTATGGALGDMLAPGALWATLWPVLVGLVLAVLLHRWRHRLPRVPEGDLVVVVERAARAAIDWSKALERAEGHLRRMATGRLVAAFGRDHSWRGDAGRSLSPRTILGHDRQCDARRARDRFSSGKAPVFAIKVVSAMSSCT